jgi:cyclopropane-fatty-acyl-phospholipid synthase
MPEAPLPAVDREAFIARLAAQGIYPCGSPQQVRLEADVARFLGREYRRLPESPPDRSIVTDSGPMWCETDALMADHYDADLCLFAAFLDQRYMAYSMAYYGETPEHIRASNASLEQAQRAKLALVCERAMVQGHERVLSIGCGFGPVEAYLGETYPELLVTGVTPSRTQAEYITTCMHSPAHPLGRLKLRLIQQDFADIPVAQLGQEAFDLVFAVAVFEHVHNLQAAIAKIAALLRAGGRAFVHVITTKVPMPRLFSAERSLIGRYFPGGRVWPFDTIAQHTAPLELEASWFLNGLNYWRTLDAWHQRFWENIPSLHPETLDANAVRHWNQYFSLCKACFAPEDGTLYGNGHYLLRKTH